MKTFAIDNRDNPKLHKLHVAWAIEELRVFREFIDTCPSMHRIHPAVIAGRVQDQITYLVNSDAAYFEAAALIFGNCDTSEYFDEAE